MRCISGCGNVANPCQGSGGQTEIVNSFNWLKIYVEIIFLFQNSYLYWVDDLERPHPSQLSRHRGGARACADDAREIGEQFCCQRSKPRQPPGRRRASGQHERLPARRAHRGVADAHGRLSALRQRRPQAARDHRDDAQGGHRSERSHRVPAFDRAASRTAFLSGGAS